MKETDLQLLMFESEYDHLLEEISLTKNILRDLFKKAMEIARKEKKES